MISTFNSFIQSVSPKTKKESPIPVKVKKIIPLKKEELLDFTSDSQLKALSNWYFLIISTTNLYQALYEKMIAPTTSYQQQKDLINCCYHLTLKGRILPNHLSHPKIKSIMCKLLRLAEDSTYQEQIGIEEHLQIKQQIQHLFLVYNEQIQKSDVVQSPAHLNRIAASKGIKETENKYQLKQLFIDYLSPHSSVLTKIQRKIQTLTLKQLVETIGNDIISHQKDLFDHLSPIEFAFPRHENYKKKIADYANQLIFFTKILILKEQTEDNQLKMLKFFHKLRNYLWMKKDFQSAFMIHAGLNDLSVTKLKIQKNFKENNLNLIKKAQQFNVLMAPESNFKILREHQIALNKANQSFIPFVSMYYRDAFFIMDINKHLFISNGQINQSPIELYNKIMEYIFNPVENFPKYFLKTDLIDLIQQGEFTENDRRLTI